MDARAATGTDACGRETVRPCVLIADDDPASRIMLRGLVELEGCNVVEAEDGTGAVAAFRAHEPDIVLLDILMPGMDGPEVARRIRTEASADAMVPIVFVTAVSDDETLAGCLAAGGDDFLVKPYSRAVLAAKLRAWLRARALHEEVRRQRDELAAHKARQEVEEHFAKRVFASLVARGEEDPPNLRRLQVSAAEFSGDLVLAATTPDGRQRVLVGDFTGHGLPAALGAVPTADIFYAMTAKGFPLASVARSVDRRLAASVGPEMFLAAALLELDPNAELVRALNAGLPDLLVVEPDGRIRRLPATEPPLGIHGVERSWAPHRWRLVEGERIYAYTDGLLEAPRRAGGTLGEEGLVEVLRAGGDTIATLRERLCLDCAAGVRDDVTLVELACEFLAVPAATLHKLKQAPSQVVRGSWRVELELGPEFLRGMDPALAVMNVLDEGQVLGEHRDAVFLVLRELTANALEHGILRLDSRVKQCPDGFAVYYAERERRLAGLTEGRLRVRVAHESDAEGGWLRIEVEDSGPGFDHEALASPGSETGARLHGRGIQLVRALCERVEFRGYGNAVEACYRWRAGTG